LVTGVGEQRGLIRKKKKRKEDMKMGSGRPCERSRLEKGSAEKEEKIKKA